MATQFYLGFARKRIKKGILFFALLYTGTSQFALIYFDLYLLPLFTLPLHYLPLDKSGPHSMTKIPPFDLD
jgi:hypothetical protein